MATPATSISSAILCSHCGESCGEDLLRQKDLCFCCAGCQTVYEILQQHQLGRYYALDDRPGISRKGVPLRQYDYLNEPSIKSQLLDFSDGQQARITFLLPQIHCASCLWLLEQLYRFDKGIHQSKVNFRKKEIHIHFSETETTPADTAAWLQRLGYPPAINLGDLQKREVTAVPKKLLYQLGVAGFLFGNIMFISFPEYLGLDKSIDVGYYHLFAYINLVMALPLVFYSGRDYLLSAWRGIRHFTLNIDIPIAIGILSLFLRSVYEIITHTGAGYMDSLAGLIFFLLVGKWFQEKTFHRISFERDYQSYFPIAATLVENGHTRPQPLHDLKVGDQLLIRHQELLPADGVLEEGAARIDYSFVTGESRPVEVKVGEMVFAGGRQMGASIRVQLTKKVAQSYLVQLWNDEAFQRSTPRKSVQSVAEKFGKYFTVIVVVVAAATLLWWLPVDVALAINAFSAVLIVACPCAIALSIPFTYGNMLRLLARRGFYLKNTATIEAIQQTTHIVFDKTGTLTESRENIHFEKILSEEEKITVKSLVRQSAHPVSKQIDDLLEHIDIQPVEQFEESIGEGISGMVNGHQVRIGKPSFMESCVVGAPHTFVEIDGRMKGWFRHTVALRKGLPEVINQLSKRFEMSLLSGDTDQHRSSFEGLFPERATLRFDQSPQNKLDYIQKLQEAGATVMMVGDGLNDAGALQQADVGLVLTESHNNFTPACDGVLQADQFESLPELISGIRAGRRVVYSAYALAIVYNLIGLSFAVQGLLSPVIAAILMPLSSITIVAWGVAGSWLVNYTWSKQDDKNHILR